MDRKTNTEFKLHLGLTYLDEHDEIQEIDAERVAHFIETVVTPILPDYTMINALGAWGGMIEPSIILVHMSGYPVEVREIIKKIGMAYKAWFRQEAVLMTEHIIMVETL